MNSFFKAQGLNFKIKFKTSFLVLYKIKNAESGRENWIARIKNYKLSEGTSSKLVNLLTLIKNLQHFNFQKLKKLKLHLVNKKQGGHGNPKNNFKQKQIFLSLDHHRLITLAKFISNYKINKSSTFLIFDQILSVVEFLSAERLEV